MNAKRFWHVAVAALALWGCGPEFAGDGVSSDEELESTQGALQCRPYSLVFRFEPSDGSWWQDADQPALAALRRRAQNGRPASDALVVNEKVVRVGNGPRWNYSFEYAYPQAPLASGVAFSLNGCAWTTRDARDLAALRVQAEREVKALGAVFTSETVRGTGGGRWHYSYTYRRK